MNDQEKLAAIAAIISGGVNAAVPGHVMLQSGPDYPTWDEHDACAVDFWVRGRLGCMKGARHNDYSIAFTTQAWMDSTHLDRYVIVSPDLIPNGSGTQMCVSVADASWTNGEVYVWSGDRSETDNYLAWTDAGRPSRNAAGITYSPTGHPIDPNSPHFGPA